MLILAAFALRPSRGTADDIDALADAMQVNDADMVSADAGLNDADDDALMAQLAADLAVKAPVDMEPAGAVGSDFDEARAEAFEAAPFNIEEPASPVIDVDVPDLEVPRRLSAGNGPQADGASCARARGGSGG